MNITPNTIIAFFVGYIVGRIAFYVILAIKNRNPQPTYQLRKKELWERGDN